MKRQDDAAILADRVAQMNATAELKAASGPNYPLYIAVAFVAAMVVGFMIYVAGGGSAATTPPPLRPANSITDPDQRSSPNTLFGDTAPPIIEPAEDPAFVAMREEMERLRQEIANRPRENMPAEYRAELEAMREDMQAAALASERERLTMKAYIETLEERLSKSERLPPRPVTLQDNKWLRAQQISAGDETGEAARIAAPSMVFDRSKEGQEENEQNAIIEEFGTGFPTSETVIIGPRQ